MPRKNGAPHRRANGVISAALPVLCREADLLTLAAASPTRAYPSHRGYLGALALTLTSLRRTGAEIHLYPLDPADFLQFCRELDLPPDAPDARTAYATEPRLLPPLLYRGEPLPEVLHALQHLRDDEQTLLAADSLLIAEAANEAELSWMRTRATDFAAATLPSLLKAAGPGRHTLSIHLGPLSAHTVATLSPEPPFSLLQPSPEAFCDLLGTAYVLADPALVTLRTHHPDHPVLRGWQTTAQGLVPLTPAQLRTAYNAHAPTPADPSLTFKPAHPLPPA
ncbi:hypothetical protein [Actinocorallia longicatena]|uniref:Uncharacterized protein n=1 Tax=Actinocorallia longicatena TaxID=111803 RepID=A0ABP6QH01_9ACTN